MTWKKGSKRNCMDKPGLSLPDPAVEEGNSLSRSAVKGWPVGPRLLRLTQLHPHDILP